MSKKLWYKEIVKTPKRLFVTGVVAFALIASGTGAALALIPSDEPKEVTVKQVAAVEPKEETPVVETAPVVETPAPQQSVATEHTPEPEPEQPKYGEDSSNPGVYIVFDKTWVMEQAGIAENDKQYVDVVLRGWIYKAPNPSANLCMASPAIKMQSFGTDYLDNPVTQLKWCADYVTKRYTTWQKAHEYFLSNNGI